MSGSHHTTPSELLLSGRQDVLSSAWMGTKPETTSVYENQNQTKHSLFGVVSYLQIEVFLNIKLVRFSIQSHY